MSLAKGEADSDDNLQLLYAHCNAPKGTRFPMAELKVVLKSKGFWPNIFWLVILFFLILNDIVRMS